MFPTIGFGDALIRTIYLLNTVNMEVFHMTETQTKFGLHIPSKDESFPMILVQTANSLVAKLTINLHNQMGQVLNVEK